MCENCGCTPCAECGQAVEEGVCIGCGMVPDECICMDEIEDLEIEGLRGDD